SGCRDFGSSVLFAGVAVASMKKPMKKPQWREGREGEREGMRHRDSETQRAEHREGGRMNHEWTRIFTNEFISDSCSLVSIRGSILLYCSIHRSSAFRAAIERGAKVVAAGDAEVVGEAVVTPPSPIPLQPPGREEGGEEGDE